MVAAMAIESDTTIPVYIVKDADCLGHNKDKQEDSVVMKLSVSPTNNTVLRYSSLQDSEDVLLVQKGPDGNLYTTGPSLINHTDSHCNQASSNSIDTSHHHQKRKQLENKKVSFIK